MEITIMKKYIILPSSKDNEKFTKLQVNHSIWGTPIRYSDDTILAAYQPDNDPFVFDMLDEAVQSLAYPTQYAVPVFEVELLGSSELTGSYESFSKSGDTNTCRKTSLQNIEKVITATHAGITYDLSTVWEQRKQLHIESIKLSARHYADDTSELKTQIDKLLELVSSLKGKQSYEELTKILKTTNELLDNPSAENLEKYITLSKIQQGAPSPAMQALGVCMLALAVAVAAMGGVVILGAGIALAACGVFAVGRRGTEVYKVMTDLASHTPSIG